MVNLIELGFTVTEDTREPDFGAYESGVRDVFSKLLYHAYIITLYKLHLSDACSAILAEGRRRYWSCNRRNTRVEYAGSAPLTCPWLCAWGCPAAHRGGHGAAGLWSGAGPPGQGRGGGGGDCRRGCLMRGWSGGGSAWRYFMGRKAFIGLGCVYGCNTPESIIR